MLLNPVRSDAGDLVKNHLKRCALCADTRAQKNPIKHKRIIPSSLAGHFHFNQTTPPSIAIMLVARAFARGRKYYIVICRRKQYSLGGPYASTSTSGMRLNLGAQRTRTLATSAYLTAVIHERACQLIKSARNCERTRQTSLVANRTITVNVFLRYRY